MKAADPPLLDASDWPFVRDEQMGSKAKNWLRHPVTRRPWLFKSPRSDTGEHWAEVLAAHAADLLGVPHAKVQLAHHGLFLGALCRSLTPDRRRIQMIHGNEVLQLRDPSYPRQSEGFTLAQHTPRRVLDALANPDIGPPFRSPRHPALRDAADHFVGYLLLDAWIGNTDRHHENWALLQAVRPPKRKILCPSYDHGSSLGRELSDDRRKEAVTTADHNRSLARYCEKCPSRFFPEDGQRCLSPTQAFRIAAADRPDAAKFWLQRLESVDLSDVQARVDHLPDPPLSRAAGRFVLAILQYQQQQLLAPTSP